MDLKLRLQLSIMMFVQFIIWGSWYVTVPNYFGPLGFTASDIGWTYAVGPIAAIISPFFVGMIADRFFAAQHVLGVMHLLGAALMFLATTLMQTKPVSAFAINLAIFVNQLTYYPTLSMSNTLAMKNMGDPEKDFPGIRVLGTIGWIVAGLALTWFGWEKSVHMFYMTIGASLFLGLFSFTLPNTPPVKEGKVTVRQILGLDALALFKDRNYLVFILASFLICIPLSFYYQITSRIVEMAGLPIGQTMSYGQMSEIFFMLVMPLFFRRLGVKWMLAVGMLAWVLRYILFAFGAPSEIQWMIIGGILLHGICYDFFFVTGQIYTDQAAPNRIRAQAQGLIVLFTLGLGMLIGAKVADAVLTEHTTSASREFAQQMVAKNSELEELKARIAAAPSDQQASLNAQIAKLDAEKTELRRSELKAIEWQPLWAKPAIFAAIILVLFVLLFKNKLSSASVKQAEAYGD